MGFDMSMTEGAKRDPKEGPKQWAREIYGRRNLGYIDEAFSDDFVHRTGQADTPTGRDSYKAYMAFLLQSYPDAEATVDDVIHEGNKVVSRWTLRGTHTGRSFGSEPSGSKVEYS